MFWLHTASWKGNGIKRLFYALPEGNASQKLFFKNEYGFDAGVIDMTAAHSE